MDFTVDPCEDFFKFSCGNWAEEHPRPDTLSSYDWFTERQSRILRNIRHYLQINNTKTDPVPVKQARDMYKACMNTTEMNNLKYKPVFKYLNDFGLPNYPTILNLTETNYSIYNFDWIQGIINVKRGFELDVMIGFDIFPDPADRDMNRLVIGTPEMGSQLPFYDDVMKRINRAKRKHMLIAEDKLANDGDDDDDDDNEDDDDDEENSIAMIAYKKFMVETMKILVNATDPDLKFGDKLENFEKTAEIAIEMTRVIYKLIEKAENETKQNNTEDRLGLGDLLNYNVYELQNITDTHIAPTKPFPVWERYLTLMFDGIAEGQINLRDDKFLSSSGDILYLKTLVDYLSKVPLVQIEMFIWWSVVEELVLHTTTEIRKLHYDYAKTMTSTEGFQSRSLYCTGGVNQLMGMAVSYAIATPDFLTQTKPKVDLMLHTIREAFNSLVRDTTWMDWKTKMSTLEKSSAMRSFIGFPEWILDKQKLEEFYDGVEVNATTHIDNMMSVLKWKALDKLIKWRLIDDFAWDTSPTNVNAFHTFQANAITIPIAILQYPFYNLGLEVLEALNYGSIGAILGHELTHGFDDSGRQFDKEGNLKQWWSNTTIKEYVNRTTCFVNQYGRYYIPEASEYIDGLLTLGENIADNGGMREAFRAYNLYVKKFGNEALLPGFEDYTHEQLFFISFGNLWCESQTPPAAKAAIEDSHCPGRIRLKGVLSNSNEFSQTFNCKPGSEMNPKVDKCRIW